MFCVCECVPASLWSGADCNTYDDTKLVYSYYTYLAAVHDEALDARRALEKTLLPGQVGALHMYKSGCDQVFVCLSQCLGIVPVHDAVGVYVVYV
jgi:hypothetical protein